FWHVRFNSSLDRNSRPLVDFGGRRYSNSIDNTSGPTGILCCAADLLSPTSLAAAGLPSSIQQTYVLAKDSRLQLSRNQFDAFLNDEIRLSGLTVNVGVRLQNKHLPTSKDGRFEGGFDSAELQR